MSRIASIMGRVRAHVEHRPERDAFVFIRRHDDDSGDPISWGDLWNAAANLAARLPERNRHRPLGSLVLCQDERRFVIALLATWMHGAVAIPAAGMASAQVLERNRHIILRSRPDIVLHDLASKEAPALQALVGDADLQPVDASDSAIVARIKEPGGAVPALLQFTSGSTSRPKAVLLNHDNIAANCRDIARTYSLHRNSVGLHWLPLYHDMGLVGSVLAALWVGVTSVILRPSVFIQRPSRWIELASAWRATITSAPNFAYERLCDAMDPATLGDLDLSCLDNVIFGGESVARETVERVRDTFAVCGLSPDALAPSYGLAEVTLLACAGKRKGGPRFSTLHSLRPAASCGAPIDSVRITVRREDSAAPCGDGELGHVWVAGDSAGVVVPEDRDWRAAVESRETRTGDRGFFQDGELYITGRDANRLVIRGRNVFSEDVESLVRESQLRGFAEGIAAFGIDLDGSQALCILIEVARRDAALNLDALNRLLTGRLGVKATRVSVLRRWTLPRTSSGKIQLARARERFLAGDYERRTLSHAI